MSGTSRRSDRRRGAGLPTTMMVAALMLSLGFTVVAMGFNHLNVAARVQNSQTAQNLAEAVVAKGVERVLTAQSQTVPGPPTETQLIVTFASGPPGAAGVLAFDAAQAGTLTTTYNLQQPLDPSTYNLDTDAIVTGARGRQVPANSVHLVGAGICNGVERRIEAVVYVPRFTHALASSGEITARDVYIAEVDDASVLDGGFPLPENQVKPGHVASNSTVGAAAIEFDGTNLITGDLHSASSWTPGPDTTVQGETRLGAEPVGLPDLDITSYDPGTGSDVTVLTGPPDPSDPPLSGLNRHSGDLTVTSDLEFSGGVLYVDGRLTVTEGIKGKGAIIARDGVSIQGASSASSDNQAAILSGGDVHIQGTNPGAAKFEGLVYAEGKFEAADITVAGVAVSNDATPASASASAASTDIENVNLIHIPEYSSFEVVEPVPGGGFEPSPVDQGTTVIYPNETLSFALEWPSTPPTLGDRTQYRADIPSLGTQELIFSATDTGFTYFNGSVDVPGGSTVPSNTSGGAIPQLTVGNGFPVRINGGPDLETEAEIRNRLEEVMRQQLGLDPGDPLHHIPAFVPTIESHLDIAARAIFYQPGSSVSRDYVSFRQNGGTVDEAEDSSTVVTGGGGKIFSVALSDFIHVSDRMRVLYWKEQWYGSRT